MLPLRNECQYSTICRVKWTPYSIGPCVFIKSFYCGMHRVAWILTKLAGRQSANMIQSRTAVCGDLLRKVNRPE